MENGSLNDGRKYCRMLPLEHAATFLTCIKPKQFFVLFEWPLKTGFTVDIYFYVLNRTSVLFCIQPVNYAIL